MAEREQWASRTGFLLAAIGSAVGLGNIWRFPYVAYSNGGGAFIVPYVFALLTAGIPLLVLEYTIGHRYRGGTALSWRLLSRKAEWIGWWQVVISFVISTYYAVVIAWACAYAWFSLRQAWGGDAEAFLMNSFLQVSEGAGQLGGIVPGVFVPLVLVWVVALGIVAAGVAGGIEKANKVMMPLLLLMFGGLVIRALTLPGALDGLNELFRPDWGRIADSSVWVAAYGQIFFTLSVGFGIMITYSSYLPKSSDLTNSAFVAGFTNSSFELLAGIGVFAALGFMAAAEGVAVNEVATDGVGLAFVVFPRLIGALPGLNALYGVLFFGSLIVAGLSSLISIVQVYVASLEEKYELARSKAVAIGGGAAAVLSLLFATNGGLYLLDATDFFANNFGIVVIGLVELIVVGWLLRRFAALRAHANVLSDIRLGAWWPIVLGLVTPAVLVWITVDNALTVFREGYEGYPAAFVTTTGVIVAVGSLVLGILLALKRWDEQAVVIPEPAYDEAGR